jgi:hypothetical protein
MTRRPAGLILALAGVCASCAAPLLKLPSGPGDVVLDGPDAVQAATAACRPLSSISLEMGVSGSIGGHRVRGRLVAGLTKAGEVRLEGIAPFGQPLFILTNNPGSEAPGATLLLSRDNRVLRRGQFPAVLEAVAGIPLDEHLLFSVLTGCIPSASSGDMLFRGLGENWRLVAAGPDDVYLNRVREGPWRLVATVHKSTSAGWKAEYRDFAEGLPRSIRLISARNSSFDLQLTLSQVELNPALTADVFTIQIPPSANPITLEELKASGPLGTNGP